MGKKKIEPNSGAYQARLQYEAFKLVDARARGEEADAEAYRELWEANRGRDPIDPVNVAQYLAYMLLHRIQEDPNWRAILDRLLEETRLIAAAEIPDVD